MSETVTRKCDPQLANSPNIAAGSFKLLILWCPRRDSNSHAVASGGF